VNEINQTPPTKKLSRQEAHDIGMIIRDRAKVLRHHAEEQAAAYRMEAEEQIARMFEWSEGDLWRKANEKANEIKAAAEETIARKCEEMGIPAGFSPALSIDWTNRGTNAISRRKEELRKAARLKIDSMLKASITQIDQQSLEHRTKVVQNSSLSPEAAAFIDSFKPIEDTMKELSISDIEKAVEDQKKMGRERFANLIYRETYTDD